MPPDALHRLLQIAAAQHGVASSADAASVGLAPGQLHELVRSGRLQRVTPSVVRAPGAPADPYAAAMVAVLDAGPGAVLAERSGAALWDVPGFDLAPHQVLALRSSSRRRAKPHTLHLTRVLPEHHRTVLHGIPVTTPTRLVFDLAASIGTERVARVVDSLWARRLTSGRLLHGMAAELCRRGRPGSAAMREILAERGPDYRPPESNLERRALSVLDEAGIHGFERQVDIGDDERWLARVDLVHERRLAILQIDGDRYHTALLDRAHDAAQQEALERAGWVVGRVTEDDVWYRPRQVRETALDTLRRAAPRPDRLDRPRSGAR